ncbi:MAG: hypothetical protein COT89_00560 [Candidatus Colwellbacteria bacterium CG10_big_fil_rev_8_21_14_0_10_42_22]|uniref:SHS2 domain-containing protein n=1 Tax=Candidatus Colwellbacteria bacterium CG10_big_fil_rev_8_21_14_0_10_42_22 TaxID=1974540 RepID=A0A2H0VGJ6_9BACT|nr:MAG: hypothetical protein COT89_00560 [Candidatus Colwellbacteria bacterium CG10_big_fil_rev_8_21_14_0_10_42_22]
MIKLSKIFTKLSPRMEVAGLWIGNGVVSYHNLVSKDGEQLSLRLPPGVVSGGKVQNQDALTSVLRELRKRTSGTASKKEQGVILTIPINTIYIQPFTLPSVASSDLKESALLNMRMISPIGIENAYYDWQKISDDNANQLQAVGAFVLKDIVDAFVGSVQNAGYAVAAVEFSTLSISRAALRAQVIDSQEPTLITRATSEGLDFSVTYKGHLFFHHLTAWNNFQEGGKSISLDRFKERFADEVRKVINFYSTNQSGQEIRKMILLSADYIEEISKVISDNFPGIEVKQVDVTQVNPATGAAIRGLTRRSMDTDISLASLSAIEVFKKRQLNGFILAWRNILIFTFSLLLFIFLGSALSLQNFQNRVIADSSFGADSANITELNTLEEQAKNFNTLLTMIKNIVSERYEYNVFTEEINKLAGSSISILHIQAGGSPLSLKVEGVGKNQGAIADYQKRVSGNPMFQDVSIPLANTNVREDGSILFNMSLKVLKVNPGE